MNCPPLKVTRFQISAKHRQSLTKENVKVTYIFIACLHMLWMLVDVECVLDLVRDLCGVRNVFWN